MSPCWGKEAERYQLEIAGLTSMCIMGSGTQLLDSSCTLGYSEVAQGEQQQTGLDLLIAPQLRRYVLEFTLGRGQVSGCCSCLKAKQQYKVPSLLGVQWSGT